MAPEAIVVTLKRAFKASILCLLCLGAAKSSQLMTNSVIRKSQITLALPAVVHLPTNTTICFQWDVVPQATSYLLCWSFSYIGVGFDHAIEVPSTNGCITYPATNSAPFVAVCAIANGIQGDFSPVITRTNYVTVTGLQSASPAGPWADLPGMTLTTEATNASAFWKLRIYQFSNWPFPPGLP